MSANSLKNVSKLFLKTVAIVLLSLSAGAVQASTFCEGAMLLGAGDAEDLLGHGTGAHWFEVRVPTAGLLKVDVSREAPRAEPLLGFWGPGCDRRSSTARIVHRGPATMILALEEGSALFRVASLGNQRGPAHYRIRTSFVSRRFPVANTVDEGGEDEDDVELDGFTHQGTTRFPVANAVDEGGEDEDDVELDGFTHQGTTRIHVASAVDEGGEDEDDVELDGFTHQGTTRIHVASAVDEGGEDEDDVELDGFTHQGTTRIHVANAVDEGGEDEDDVELDGFAGLCRMAASDDHGDSRPCASRVQGSKLRGSIDHRGDRDVFRLDLPNRSENEIWRFSAAFPAGIDLKLYDREGHRLRLTLSDRTGGSQAETALSAGVYFLEASGAEQPTGEYALKLQATRW